MLFFDYLKYSNSNLSMIEYIIQKRYVLRYLFLYHDTYLDVCITIYMYLNNAMNLYIPNCFTFFTSLTFSLSVNMTLITVTETEWIDFLGLKAF